MADDVLKDAQRADDGTVQPSENQHQHEQRADNEQAAGQQGGNKLNVGEKGQSGPRKAAHVHEQQAQPHKAQRDEQDADTAQHGYTSVLSCSTVRASRANSAGMSSIWGQWFTHLRQPVQRAAWRSSGTARSYSTRYARLAAS